MKPNLRAFEAEPGVGAGRAEVELGAVAVQARARRRNPLRVRVGGEQACLLGVGAEGAGDRQRMAVAARRRRHPVERLGDVGAHRLAHPVGERAVVAAARPRAAGKSSAAPAGGLSAATARALTATRRRRRDAGPSTFTRTESRIRTATRVGANEAPGKVTSPSPTRAPLRRAPLAAARRARAR